MQPDPPQRLGAHRFGQPCLPDRQGQRMPAQTPADVLGTQPECGDLHLAARLRLEIDDSDDLALVRDEPVLAQRMGQPLRSFLVRPGCASPAMRCPDCYLRPPDQGRRAVDALQRDGGDGPGGTQLVRRGHLHIRNDLFHHSTLWRCGRGVSPVLRADRVPAVGVTHRLASRRSSAAIMRCMWGSNFSELAEASSCRDYHRAARNSRRSGVSGWPRRPSRHEPEADVGVAIPRAGGLRHGHERGPRARHWPEDGVDAQLLLHLPAFCLDGMLAGFDVTAGGQPEASLRLLAVQREF